MPLPHFTSDASQLPTAQKKKRPTFKFDFARTPSAGTIIRRQTTEQANRPVVPAFTPPGQTPQNEARQFGIATLPGGFDFNRSQFPFEQRRGISSDASRQRAFRLGFGSGEGRGGFARKAAGQFFDPRFMFNPSFKRFTLQNRLRRRHGL